MPAINTGRESKRLSSAAALALIALFAAVITFVVYLPSLKSGFVNWDDPDYIFDNPDVRSLDLSRVEKAFTTPSNANWHPLTSISYAVDYAVWGYNPLGYHLVNNIFHAINTALVFVLAIRLLGECAGQKRASPDDGGYDASSVFSAIVSALLFGLHPLHVESVSWLSERKDVLSAFFFILSVLSYLRYAHVRTTGRYALTLALFILALMSKPMAITLPAVLLILDFYPLGRLDKKNGKAALIEKLPFFALSAASAVLTIWAQRSEGAVVAAQTLGPLLRVDTVFRGYAFYIYKTLVPFGLAPYYPLPFFKQELFNGVFAASLFFIAATTALCVFTVKKTRVFLAVWLYYLVTLSPVIGMIQVGAQAAADRYMYLPSIGVFILAGAGFGALFNRPVSRGRAVAGAAAVVAIAAALCVLAIKQQYVWQSSLTLWTHEISIYPDRVPRAHMSKGLAYQELGMYNEAIESLTTAVTINPTYADAYNNRGVVYKTTGNYGLARRDFLAAIAINSRHATAYYNLATLYSDMGQTELAVQAMKKAEELGVK